jgi:REP element-mobilizing transposase RayT
MPFKPVPRMKTFDYIGINRYFLTICSRQRTRVFVDHDAVALVLLHLARTADVEHVAVIAYCFMPDHSHALAEGTRMDSDFQRFVRVFKQRSSFEWKRRTGNPRKLQAASFLRNRFPGSNLASSDQSEEMGCRLSSRQS